MIWAPFLDWGRPAAVPPRLGRPHRDRSKNKAARTARRRNRGS